MNVCRSKARALLIAVAAVLSFFQISTSANAVTWTLSPDVPFSDGGTLNGYFNINVYGFTTAPWDMQTSGGSPAFAVDYNTSINADNPNILTVQFNAPADSNGNGSYSSFLYLVFEHSLLVPIANNPIVGGDPGPSFECENYGDVNGNCPGPVRYILSGYASADGLSETGITPLPAALPLFAGGLGFVGLLARRRRKKGVAVRADA